jgi:hypothetical protein
MIPHTMMRGIGTRQREGVLRGIAYTLPLFSVQMGIRQRKDNNERLTAITPRATGRTVSSENTGNIYAATR